MELSQFLYLILPLAFIIVILIGVVLYLSKKSEESVYEKEMKWYRQSLLKGEINRKSFLYIRDNLKADELFSEESKRLDDMLKQKKMDSETYVRMKEVLQMTFNDKLVKINQRYDFDNSIPTGTPPQ
jgi:hypothetical protein